MKIKYTHLKGGSACTQNVAGLNFLCVRKSALHGVLFVGVARISKNLNRGLFHAEARTSKMSHRLLEIDDRHKKTFTLWSSPWPGAKNPMAAVRKCQSEPQTLVISKLNFWKGRVPKENFESSIQRPEIANPMRIAARQKLFLGETPSLWGCAPPSAAVFRLWEQWDFLQHMKGFMTIEAFVVDQRTFQTAETYFVQTQCNPVQQSNSACRAGDAHSFTALSPTGHIHWNLDVLTVCIPSYSDCLKPVKNIVMVRLFQLRKKEVDTGTHFICTRVQRKNRLCVISCHFLHFRRIPQQLLWPQQQRTPNLNYLGKELWLSAGSFCLLLLLGRSPTS